jgi:hypothetical protein
LMGVQAVENLLAGLKGERLPVGQIV